MSLGKIIFLHGATSSGKTTIAMELQKTLDTPFLHISIDHLRDSGVLPLARYKSGEFNWKEYREAFFKGFHLSLRAYATGGNDLIVEHIIETREWKAELIDILKGIDVFFVGVRCPLEELERRETLRGDRPLGGARKDYETIHEFNTYDLELDGTQAAAQNVALIISSWKNRQSTLFYS